MKTRKIFFAAVLLITGLVASACSTTQLRNKTLKEAGGFGTGFTVGAFSR